MAKFDFDTPFSREGTASEKHEMFRAYDAIPMWVADTDFKSPEVVQQALAERISHGAFGYTAPSDLLMDATLNWLSSRYQWHIEKDWIVWLPGVVPGFNLANRTLTEPGDAIAVQTPNYPPLLKSALINNRKRLLIETKETDGKWQLDFESLETQFKDPECKLFILCNPMNPCGTRLNEAELQRIINLSKQHNVSLCSDEIHCDLILSDDQPHIPLGKLDPGAITLMAASKTFNIAGLGCSFAIIQDKALRHKFQQQSSGLMSYPNLLGFTATEAAFIGGSEWLSALIEYLRENLNYLIEFLPQLPGLKLIRPDATFLAWIDCTETGLDNPFKFFLENGVALSDGKDFGKPGFIRLNFGCPRSQLTEALERMKKALVFEK